MVGQVSPPRKGVNHHLRERIRSWRRDRSESLDTLSTMSPHDFDFLHLVICRDEVERNDRSSPLATLNKLLETRGSIRAFRTRVDISFFGYDEDPQELFEMPAVRDYVVKLDNDFPYWLYFLARECTGLQCLALCMLPPFLTEEARVRIHQQMLADLLERRWVPALNHLCATVGEADDEADQLLDSAITYFREGPERMRA
jgi:hypothetical protein